MCSRMTLSPRSRTHFHSAAILSRVPAGGNPSDRTRLDSLTGLRFYAALVVVIHHVTRDMAPIPMVTDAFLLGGVGVGFFFVLSGFVLAWSRRPSEPDRTFYRHRFARVYPLVAVTWVGGLVILATQRNLPELSVTIASILLLQAWVPSLPFLNGVNGPSWSLSTEAFFYATLPALHRAVSNRTTRALLIICGSVVGAAAVVALLLRGFIGGDAVALFLYMNPVYRLWEFMLGIALALLVKRGRVPNINLAVAGTTVLIAFFGMAAINYAITHDFGPFARLPFDSLPTDLASLIISPLCGALIVAAAQRDQAGNASHLASRPMVLLGTWSFALYLTHMLLVMVVSPAIPAGLPIAASVAIAVATIVTAIAISWAAYSFIEHPLERAIRRGPKMRDRRLESASASHEV